MALLLCFASVLMTAAPRILVHGHRGARAVLPENTIPAFEHAIEAGADVLELDLAVTSDNIAVVSHDSILHAGICTGPGQDVAIRTLTFAQLQQYDCGSVQNPLFPKQKPVPGTKMPSLDQVLALGSRGKFEFNIETKLSPKFPDLAPPPEEFARIVLGVIRKHRMESRVILQSFDFRTLHAMKKLAPEIRLSALYAGEPRDFVAIAHEAGAPIVSPHYSLITRQQVQAAQKAGLQVVPWTPNTPADWDLMIAAGVDAIITDDPSALIAYLRSRP